jgi:hypothetical protein
MPPTVARHGRERAITVTSQSLGTASSPATSNTVIIALRIENHRRGRRIAYAKSLTVFASPRIDPWDHDATGRVVDRLTIEHAMFALDPDHVGLLR